MPQPQTPHSAVHGSAETARRARCCENSVSNAVKRGLVTPLLIAGRRLFTEDDIKLIKAYVAGNKARQRKAARRG